MDFQGSQSTVDSTNKQMQAEIKANEIAN